MPTAFASLAAFGVVALLVRFCSYAFSFNKPQSLPLDACLLTTTCLLLCFVYARG